MHTPAQSGGGEEQLALEQLAAFSLLARWVDQADDVEAGVRVDWHEGRLVSRSGPHALIRADGSSACTLPIACSLAKNMGRLSVFSTARPHIP